MINWDEFDHIHVIKKLREVLSSWWNVDIVFTNEKGDLKSHTDEKSIKNLAVINFLKTPDGTKNLSQEIQSEIKKFKNSKEHFVLKKWCDSGADMIIFPILIDGEVMGTAVGLGFIKDLSEKKRLSEIEERLNSLGLNLDIVSGILSDIHLFQNEDKSRFIDLVSLVCKEIITLHLEITARQDRIHELNREIGSRYKYDNMIGKSESMQSVYALLDKIKQAESTSTVLIQGENGTGKELIAKSIHYNSSRSSESFVIQNCSALNDNLLESELFGHVKGAFTGAHKDKKGLFEIADKGTFFLDEIGDTSPQMQVKLLRVLQEGTFTPVGSTQSRKVNVRIVAATNKNLLKMVEEKLFREDLFYRLNVINLKVPSLRERKEDVPLLADFFIELSCKKMNMDKKNLTTETLQRLYDYSWPGNVRELQNEMERIIVLSGDEVKIRDHMLSSKITESKNSKIQGTRLVGRLKDAIEDLEKNMIEQGLRRTGWNKSQVAKELGISRAGLTTKVEKYNLDKRKFRKV